MLLISPPSLLFDRVEALVKEVRDQGEMLMGDSEREARARAVAAVRPFRDADKSLLMGGRSIGWRGRTRYW